MRCQRVNKRESEYPCEEQLAKFLGILIDGGSLSMALSKTHFTTIQYRNIKKNSEILKIINSAKKCQRTGLKGQFKIPDIIRVIEQDKNILPVGINR